MIAAAIYLSVRGSMAGCSAADTSKLGKLVKICMVFALSVAVTVFNGIRNFTLYGEKYTGAADGRFIAVLAVSFISSLVFISFILGAVYSVEKLGQKDWKKSCKMMKTKIKIKPQVM